MKSILIAVAALMIVGSYTTFTRADDEKKGPVVGVLIGVQQLRYPEFSELGRLASRTLNQRQIIANNIGVRRAADVLASSASLAEVCQTLRGCLERAGFDGITLYLDSGIPAAVQLHPFTRNDQGECIRSMAHGRDAALCIPMFPDVPC